MQTSGQETNVMIADQELMELEFYRAAPPGLAELRDEWGRLSRERLGLSRQQWLHTAATELLRALLTGDDVEPALCSLGEARAAAGVSLADTLADLAVLDELAPWHFRHPSMHLDRLATAAAVGTAWAETYHESSPMSCLDELTGLVTTPFLVARLEQIYRHCDYLGMCPSDTYTLVVAQIDRKDPSPFTRVAQRLRLARDLRLCFPGGDTLAVFEPTEASQTMAALTSRVPELPTAMGGLAMGGGRRRIWAETLPDDVEEAVELVSHLPNCEA